MTSLLKYTKLAVPVLLATSVAASATTLDFTSDSVDPFAGSIGTNGWTLVGSPDAAIKGDDIDNNNTTVLLDAAGLDGDFDGIGIGPANPDEVDGDEFLTLSFDRKVKVTGVFFLDLFIANDGSGTIEQAGITNGVNEEHFDAVREFRKEGGFLSASLKMNGDTFTFFDPFGANDAVGVGDFALAGVTVEAIPLPAGFLLLGTALGGLGLARRRKKA